MSSDAIATSVSKGCFAFKGKSKRVNEENFYPVTGDKFVKGRLKIYRQLWEELNIQIEILRSDLNCQIFDSLIDFVSGCHDNRGLNANKGMPAGFTGEIPTAVIVMGVNTPDHGVMFSNLDSMLRSKVTPLVARLNNKDCERINTVINCIVSQFMNLSLHDEDDDDEAGFLGLGEKSIDRSSNPVKLQAAPRRRKAVSMTTLVKWYRKNYHRDSVLNELSPEKKTKISTELPKLDCDAQRKHQDANGSHKKKPLLIIMLEDVENINPRVLQDFISLCSSYQSSLPIVLVMGVATAVTAIHQLLPTAVSSLLCMEKYQAPPASQYLTQLMDKVVMTPNLPFKLGPNVFHFLLDIFLYHDFSILNFTMGYQSCMLEHFLNNPMSCLCCDEEDIDNVISQLTRAHLEQIRQHRSFKSFVMGLPSEIQESVATEDIATKKQLAVGLRALHSFHKRLFPALRFLHILSLELPKFPLGKQFREIYSICLTEELSQSEGYIQAFTYLQLMSLDDLTKLLSQAVSTLKDTKETVPEIGTLSKEVEGFIYRLKHIDEEKEEEDFDNEDGASMHRILPQRAKLHELKATLQSFSSRRRRSPYENLREEILDCLKSHFKQLIKHPLSLPLYDVLYFDDLSLIKNQIKPAPRHSTQMALVDPGRYLNCVCCECDIDDILPTMPDICIAYKLHLECGTLINLYDWLQAFITVVTSHEKGGRKKSDAKQNDELRARFIRAVSEMQFLGFIKSSKRKTDHVTRLTW